MEQAFREGINRFTLELTKDVDKVKIAKSAANIQDIQALARASLVRYSDEQRFSSAKKWLQRIISRVYHYGNVMDVLVQHHPEYVALAWGAMKLVFIAAQNHEATVRLISKALSQIADTLPRVELATILYPTTRMKRAVGNLYANLVRFFIRADQWCSEGSWKHLVHSITRPVELRYNDLLADIEGDSREIDQLASAASRVEIREINLTLATVVAKLDSMQVFQSSSRSDINQKLSDILAMQESMQALQSSAFIDTDQKLSDLQFSNIMSHISDNRLGDPLEAFRFNQSLQRNSQYTRAFSLTDDFWNSPKLQTWSSMSISKIAVIKGGFSARFAMRRVSINMIQQLQFNNVPVLWALRGPRGNTEVEDISAIDLLKHLTYQALRLNNSSTEKGMSLRCQQFHRAVKEQDWLQLLGSALSFTRSQVYVVIDLTTLNYSPKQAGDFSWVSGFHNLLASVAKLSPNLKVKVLLLGGPASFGTSEDNQKSCDLVIPVRVTQPPLQRRKRIGRR